MLRYRKKTAPQKLSVVQTVKHGMLLTNDSVSSFRSIKVLRFNYMCKATDQKLQHFHASTQSCDDFGKQTSNRKLKYEHVSIVNSVAICKSILKVTKILIGLSFVTVTGFFSLYNYAFTINICKLHKNMYC